MSTLLSVRGLTQHFRLGGLLRRGYTVHAVDGISFDLKQGETLGLVGESGCGKSTLGRTLLKLFEPSSGTITFEGRDITRLSPREMRSLRQEMQMVFQDPAESLNSRHTVGQILEEPFIIHGKGCTQERRIWVDELLAKVGLPTSARDRYPHEFSGGQRQRIGIARAIALRPKLLICDEAVSALDVSVQSQIINLLLTLQREMHLAIIFIAHDLSVVKHISDRIAVMYLGRIVELADAQSLYLAPRHPYTQALISAILVPDPRRRSQRILLTGDVPSPISPPSGCHFHQRCPHATELCKSKAPKLEACDEGHHQVSCHTPLAVGSHAISGSSISSNATSGDSRLEQGS
jgi:peptide/nickel transport system ATP-binding protein